MKRLLPPLALLWLLGCLKAPVQQPRPNDGSVIVVAAGDISEPTLGAQQLTATLVEQQHPAAVLVLGDAQYPQGSLEDFQKNYGPTWGRFKDLTWPVPGNHEYWGSEAAGYFGYFGARAGEPSKGYYSFDLGDWHLVALNTNHNCEHVSCEAESEQLAWLEADLARSTKKCTLAYWHHPRFNSGKHGNFTRARPIWQLLLKHQVELVLNGHEHFYERIGPVDETGLPSDTGVVQLTVGTGGAGFSEFTQVHPASMARSNDTFGVVRLRLGPGDWETDFVGVPRSDASLSGATSKPGSTFLDHASGRCR